MDTININEKIAEMMGWIRGDNHDDVFPMKYWKTIAGIIMYELKDWHPDTDIGQALMCAEKLNPYQIEIIYPENKIGTYLARIFCDTKGGQMYQGAGDTKELAICEAILEAMEAK